MGNEWWHSYLFGSDGLLPRPAQIFKCFGVRSEIRFASDEDYWLDRTVMPHFCDPLHDINPRLVFPVVSLYEFQPTLSSMFSKEAGLSMAKQMRTTCESEYESGRRRS